MKGLILSFLTLSLTTAVAAELPINKGLRWESQIVPGNQKEIKAFYNIARRNPTASLVVSLDIDGDGVPESYIFRPSKDDNCNFTSKDDDCDGLTTADVEVKAIAETLVTKIREPGSGMATGKRLHSVTTESQTSVVAYNGSILIKKVEEVIEGQRTSGQVSYESVTIEFKDPSAEFKAYLRKGWDGTIKGLSSSDRKGWDGSIKGSKITLTINSDKEVLGRVVLQGVSEPGRLEECASTYVCNEKLDSILNLIR